MEWAKRYRVVLLVVCVLVASGLLALFLSGEEAPLSPVREALLGAPHSIDLTLVVDVAPGTDREDPDHQEMTAAGVFDFAAMEGELTYDYQGLNNAAGFLGHLAEMDAVFSSNTVYFDIFGDSPRWVLTEPDDALNNNVDRLRDIMLTNPLILPALLQIPDAPDVSSEVSFSVPIDDLIGDGAHPLGSMLGEVLGRLGTDQLDIQLTLDGEKLSQIVVAFTYPIDPGSQLINTVQATYDLRASSSEVSPAVPPEVDVRDFDSIFE